MALALVEQKTKIAVTTSVLFDMSEEDSIWRREKAGELSRGSYYSFMRGRIDDPLKYGPAFDNIKALAQSRSHEIILMSRNSPLTALRAMRTLLANHIIPAQYVFTNGCSITPYLPYYKPDEFRTTNESDAQEAANLGFASLVYDHVNPDAFVEYEPQNKVHPLFTGPRAITSLDIRQSFQGKVSQEYIASHVYDFDGVLAGLESEEIFERHGLDAYRAHEEQNARIPLSKGTYWERFFADAKNPEIKAHIVSTRGGKAGFRPIEMLAYNNVEPDGEVHCVGGEAKGPLLGIMKDRYPRGFHFFDDSHSKVKSGLEHGVLAGRVVTPKPRDPAA
ncbi:MAG: 5'-nucleotidase [Alphaproteobacteria bacterium]|nr:5'-nucleotidase [Alphaproteobacteria bacterium]NCQ88920.1 5'-nucleotidase [Alphaproteobacteria bacterium]NCT07823.1 5'-nucleotidase [Alphaproteobacteria bacterium]